MGARQDVEGAQGDVGGIADRRGDEIEPRRERSKRRGVVLSRRVERAPSRFTSAGATARLRLCRFRLRSEEHTSELQSLMRISYAVFCLKKKKNITQNIKMNSKKYSYKLH